MTANCPAGGDPQVRALFRHALAQILTDLIDTSILRARRTIGRPQRVFLAFNKDSEIASISGHAEGPSVIKTETRLFVFWPDQLFPMPCAGYVASVSVEIDISWTKYAPRLADNDVSAFGALQDEKAADHACASKIS